MYVQEQLSTIEFTSFLMTITSFIIYNFIFHTFPNQPHQRDKENLNKGNNGCSVFGDLQKTFDIVEHILLSMLKYSVPLTENNLVLLMDVSNQAPVKHGIPEGLVLGLLLLLIQIENLNQSMSSCKVHHVAGTNLLYCDKLLSSLNKQINLNMKYLTVCLNADKTH